jgi:DNA-binding LytR/AlgR family response regulator
MKDDVPLKVVVASPDSAPHEAIAALVAEEPSLELVAGSQDPVDAAAVVREAEPDVLIVGIEFTSIGGADVDQPVGHLDDAAVIVVADDDREAAGAFEAGAVDYLVRPFDAKRMELAVRRAVAQAARSNAIGDVPGMQQGSPRQELSHIMVKRKHEFIFLLADQVERVEAERNYVRIYSRGENYQLRARIKDIEAVLDPALFARIHRSTIINVKLIERLQRGFNGDYVVRLRSGAEVRLTRSYSAAFFKRFVISPGP